MEQENNVAVNTTEETPLTFDEILKDKEYQREFDRRVSKALDTAKEKWNAEAELKQSEAEKLAKMKDDEKKSYEIEKANKRANDAEAELNAYKLEKEAVKIAEEKGVSAKALSLINFKATKAEDVETHIDTIKSIIDAEVERIVSERMKESTPKTVVGGATQTTDLPKFF